MTTDDRTALTDTERESIAVKQCGWCARFGHTTDEHVAEPGERYYRERGWSGCAGSAWDRLAPAARDGWGHAERLTDQRDAAVRELDALREAVEGLADEWERKAGPSSDAWRVYGPQVISIPFAVKTLRAVLAATRPDHTPDGES